MLALILLKGRKALFKPGGLNTRCFSVPGFMENKDDKNLSDVVKMGASEIDVYKCYENGISIHSSRSFCLICFQYEFL